MTSSSRQIKAARELLGMSQEAFAKASGISRATLAALESDGGDPKRSTLQAVEMYLWGRGIRFVDEEGVIGRAPADQPPA